MMMKLYFTFFQNTSWFLENINLVTFHEPLPSLPIHFLKRRQQLFCIVCFCLLFFNSLHQFFFIHSTFTSFIWKHYILSLTSNVALGSHYCICFLFPRHQSQVHDRLSPHRTQDFEWRKPMRKKKKRKKMIQENSSIFSAVHFLRKTDLLLSKILFKVWCSQDQIFSVKMVFSHWTLKSAPNLVAMWFMWKPLQSQGQKWFHIQDTYFKSSKKVAVWSSKSDLS